MKLTAVGIRQSQSLDAVKFKEEGPSVNSLRLVKSAVKSSWSFLRIASSSNRDKPVINQTVLPFYICAFALQHLNETVPHFKPCAFHVEIN